VSTDTGFEWRPLAPADVAAWAALIAAIQTADQDEDILGEDDLAEEFSDPEMDFGRGSIAVYDGEIMIAVCVVSPRTEADPVHMMRLWGGVHPRYRGLGIGTRLLGWAQEAAIPLHAERFPGRPLSVVGTCLAKVTGAVALFENLGYHQARWFHAMDCDLTAPIPAGQVPDGVKIVGYTPEHSADARMIRNAAFRDHWDSTEITEEGWAYTMNFHAFRPAYSFLAYAEGEPVGVLIAHEYETANEVLGRRDVYIALVGTLATARKRGIASALMVTAMTAARADGFVSASLGVDADSPTGAFGLYERIGFTIRDTSISMVRPLLPESAG
jgi:mycothiol synthase